MALPVGDEWLSLSAAAKILGVHPSTLRAWTDRGDIPAHRTAGQHRRFLRSDVETWAASRREARSAAGQMVIQNALGRTRMQMAEGRLSGTTWYARFDETRKHQFRESGRALLSLLLRYIGEESDATIEEGRAIGRAYERIGRAVGLSLSETVNVFLYFRDFLYESVVEVYQASGQRAAHEWADMHRRITRFTNAVLLALIEAHETASPLNAPSDL